MKFATGPALSRLADRAVAVMLVFWSFIGPNVAVSAAAEPANPFGALGLPTISVTIANTAFEGVPATLSAGRYVLAVSNEYDDVPGDTAGAALLRLPAGIQADDFTSLVANAERSWPASWYDETMLAGGAYAALGQTAFAVIDLTAGDWMLWSEAPGSPQAPEPIVVTGAMPEAPPTPDADVKIALSEFAIAFEAPLRAGPQIIEVANLGRQPHFVFVGSVAAGTTKADAQAAFAAYWDPESAPPAPFPFAETPELIGTGDQSAGTKAWYAIDLPAGRVVVACFVTDQETGEPHAMLGMTEILDIG